MDEHEMHGAIDALRRGYNPPPPAPREEMWTVVRAGLPGPLDEDRAEGGDDGDTGRVVSLEAARRTRSPRRAFAWAAAAAAVLVLGVGIGRMTAPVPPTVAEAGAGETRPGAALMRTAAVEHLGRSEAFLSLVRTEARAGALDPELAVWAAGLLSQTRLFLDVAGDEADPTVTMLMEDLELVLAQIVGVAEEGPEGAARARTELDLALRGLDEREVMTRIQAVSAPTLAGT